MKKKLLLFGLLFLLSVLFVSAGIVDNLISTFGSDNVVTINEHQLVFFYSLDYFDDLNVSRTAYRAVIIDINGFDLYSEVISEVIV